MMFYQQMKGIKFATNEFLFSVTRTIAKVKVVRVQPYVS